MINPPPSVSTMFLASSSDVRLQGLLGQALAASHATHLTEFIQDEKSPPITLFCASHTEHNQEGDWYGEHAGKWLSTAALAVERTGDDGLRARLRKVADFLVSQQSVDGYLGTYASARRFMCKQVQGIRGWDGTPNPRTWDVWVHGCMIQGLLSAGRALHETSYVDAARRIGDLCFRVFVQEGMDITTLGNHHGLSATVLLDPVVELFLVTKESRYLDLAKAIAQQCSAAPNLQFLPQALAGTDAAFIATGKAYQICWQLVGFAKLFRATGEQSYLNAVLSVWDSIRRHHLTLGGGPWGGVAHRSREVFNPPGVFSPYGYVETCSTFAWIQLNRELLAITSEARFAEEIEKAAYNDLLGAQTPAGDNWCYYSFPNGRRVYTTYWRCCKSSGPWALEELPGVAYGRTGPDAISVNLYGPGTALLGTETAGLVHLEQVTTYPFAGDIMIKVIPERAGYFTLRLRIPAWATDARLLVNGRHADVALQPDSFASLSRLWQTGDTVALHLPMRPRMMRQVHRNIQESRAPDGSPVQQEVLHFDYVAIMRGPLVYSTSLIDGYKIEETIRLPAKPEEALSTEHNAPPDTAPAVELALGYRPALVFRPYFEAGGRDDGTWRLTWLQLAPI